MNLYIKSKILLKEKEMNRTITSIFSHSVHLCHFYQLQWSLQSLLLQIVNSCHWWWISSNSNIMSVIDTSLKQIKKIQLVNNDQALKKY